MRYISVDEDVKYIVDKKKMLDLIDKAVSLVEPIFLRVDEYADSIIHDLKDMRESVESRKTIGGNHVKMCVLRTGNDKSCGVYRQEGGVP